MKKVIIFLVCVINSSITFGYDNVKAIVKLIKDNSKDQALSRFEAYKIIEIDSDKDFLNKIENLIKNENSEILTRFKAIKSRLLFYKLNEGDSLYISQMKKSLNEAYQYGNQYMIAEYSRWYGEMINSVGNLQEAIQHCAYAVQLQEYLGPEHFPNYHEFCLNLGELLYKSAYFEEALPFFYKGLENANNIPHPDLVGNSYLGVGISLRIVNKYDSSLIILEKGMKYAQKTKQINLFYACNRNRFESFFELKKIDSCEKVIEDVFKFSKILGNSKASIAAAYQIKGKLLRHKNQTTEAINLLKLSIQYRNESNLSKINTHAYKDLYEIYFENKDSIQGAKYLKSYQELINARNATKAAFNSDFILAKAKFEKEQLKFKSLLKEKEKRDFYGIIIIVSLIVLLFLFIYFFNKKSKHTILMKLDSEKKLKEKNFEFINKEKEILDLKHKIETKELSNEKIKNIKFLSSKTILTESDWEFFQKEFNEIYPQFIYTLKERFKGLTESEIRFASLQKLLLNTKQIAGILGISIDSVHKGRQRLRQRIGAKDSDELELVINSID